MRELFEYTLPSLYRVNKCRKLYNECNPTIKKTGNSVYIPLADKIQQLYNNYPTFAQHVAEKKTFFLKLSADAYCLTGMNKHIGYFPNC